MKRQNKKVRKQIIKRTKTVSTKRKQFIKRRKTVNTKRKTNGGEGEEFPTDREYQFNTTDIEDYLRQVEINKHINDPNNDEREYHRVKIEDVYNELYPRPRTTAFEGFDTLDLKTRKNTFYAALFNIICRVVIKELMYENDKHITRRLKRQFNNNMTQVESFLYHTGYLSGVFGDTKISLADVTATDKRFTTYITKNTASLETEINWFITPSK